MSGISRAESLSLWSNQASLPVMDSNMRETHGRVGKYLVLWDLGQGEFGKVRACVVDKNADAKAADGEYALKSINKQELIAKRDLRRAIRAIKRINSEVEALSQLSPHQNICSLIDTMQTSDYVHMVLERADSDLYDWYEGPLPEIEAMHVTKQLANALVHCHAHNIAHRDLKPENVLIAGAHRLKSRVMLCDFGLCAMYTEEHRGLTDFVGSPGFYAPELLSDEPYDGEKVDVWSLGAVLLEMLLGHSQFDQMWLGVYKKESKDLGDGTHLRRKLAHVLNELDPILFEHTGRSASLRDLLVLGLLDVRPRNRPLADAVAHSEWLYDGDISSGADDAEIPREDEACTVKPAPTESSVEEVAEGTDEFSDEVSNPPITSGGRAVGRKMKLSLQMTDVNTPAPPGSAAAAGVSVMTKAGTTPTANTPSAVQHYFEDVDEDKKAPSPGGKPVTSTRTPPVVRHGSVPDMKQLESDSQSKEQARQQRAPLTPAMATISRKTPQAPASEGIAAYATPMANRSTRSFFGNAKNK